MAAAGYRVGLLQKRAERVLRRERPIHEHIRAAIEAGQAILVEPRQVHRVTARLAVLHNPHAFETLEPGFP